MPSCQPFVQAKRCRATRKPMTGTAPCKDSTRTSHQTLECTVPAALPHHHATDAARRNARGERRAPRRNPSLCRVPGRPCPGPVRTTGPVIPRPHSQLAASGCRAFASARTLLTRTHPPPARTLLLCSLSLARISHRFAAALSDRVHSAFGPHATPIGRAEQVGSE
jgi:hypothetical protein